MDMPITRGAAYLLRNRTTHSWYGDGLISSSCPSARTLEDHIRSSHATGTSSSGLSHGRHQVSRCSTASDTVDNRAIPFTRKTAGLITSAASSPGTTSPNIFSEMSGGEQAGRNHRRRRTTDLALDSARPPSAYSYDGGFFVTANNHSKDSFVINPEWISEVEQAKAKAISVGPGKDGVDWAGSKGKVITWKSYASKRSKSAPPARFRNPITWIDQE